ncbi:MAG TPA: DUF2125 domain-containing protein [Devosiaceae bacterium]|nr:DUF2125 domain-containing protein [Devosiaceae bacterium]
MKRIAILAIVIVVVIGGWSAAWFVASGMIRQNITQLASADGQATPRVTCSKLDIGGYPFWFDVACSDLTVTQGDLTGNVAQVKATALAYSPWQVLLRVSAPATLEDAFSGSKERLDWQNLEASAHLTGWRIERISVVGDGLALSDTVAGANLMGKAAHAEFHLLDIPEQHDAQKGLAALRLYATATGLDAPGFQITDGKSTLDARISGVSDDVRTYGDADLLKRWQTAGGKIDLAGFTGNAGAQSFDIKGSIGLDTGGHPAGQLSLASKGLVERFGSAVPDQYRALVLGNPGADGTYQQTLTFTNGLIFSGVIPLGTLPALM